MTWEEMYELAKIYYEYHGNTEILQGFKTKNGYEYDETGVNLGRWINNQRTRQENLTEERKQKLELIDFRFEVKRNNMTWEKMYDLAKIYYDYHGNTEIPYKFKTKNGYEYDETGVKLGIWTNNQRRNQEKLTEERKQKLELIDFRFAPKKEHKAKITKLCTQYGIDYKNNKEILKIPYQELHAKINFLLDNDYEISVNEELNPIFFMSNIDMQQQYGLSKEELIVPNFLRKVFSLELTC